MTDTPRAELPSRSGRVIATLDAYGRPGIETLGNGMRLVALPIDRMVRADLQTSPPHPRARPMGTQSFDLVIGEAPKAYLPEEVAASIDIRVVGQPDGELVASTTALFGAIALPEGTCTALAAVLERKLTKSRVTRATVTTDWEMLTVELGKLGFTNDRAIPEHFVSSWQRSLDRV